MDLETAKSKVAKLMAMAMEGEGRVNEHEAETALRQAEALMRKHSIELADIADHTGHKPVYAWSTVMVPVSAPKPVKQAPVWFGPMASSIGKFTDTKVSYAWHAEHQICIKVQGDETDVAYAVWLVKRLRDTIRADAAAYASPGYNSDQRWANREAFRMAMANRLGLRMRELRSERDVALASSGTALVIVQDKVALRDAEFGAQTYGRGHRTVRGSSAAIAAGRAAGENVGLTRPLPAGDTSDVSPAAMRRIS